MKYRFLSFLVILLFVTGCSGKVPLGGTVTFSDDGSPLTRGAVFLKSEKLVAQGAIKSDGTFRMGTDKLTDGLPPGTYKVYIAGAELSELVPYAGGADGQGKRQVVTPLIDSKFSDANTSGLSVVVDGKTKKFDIKVDRYQKGK